MRSSVRFALGLGSVLFLLGATAVRAQDAGGPPVPKPTPEHKVFEGEVGIWDATVTAFGGPPGAPPMVSKGVEVNTLVTGGLWLTSRFTSDFGGTPFEGRGQFGYDAEKKKYIGTWIDSMTPTITMLEGSYDAKTKTMTYVGESVDPTGKSKVTQKMVSSANPDGTRSFTLYMKGEMTGGKEVKAMEVAYKKRKFTRRDGPEESPAGSKP